MLSHELQISAIITVFANIYLIVFNSLKFSILEHLIFENYLLYKEVVIFKLTTEFS